MVIICLVNWYFQIFLQICFFVSALKMLIWIELFCTIIWELELIRGIILQIPLHHHKKLLVERKRIFLLTKLGLKLKFRLGRKKVEEGKKSRKMSNLRSLLNKNHQQLEKEKKGSWKIKFKGRNWSKKYRERWEKRQEFKYSKKK